MSEFAVSPNDHAPTLTAGCPRTWRVVEPNGPVLQIDILVLRELESGNGTFVGQTLKRLATVGRVVHPRGVIPLVDLREASSQTVCVRRTWRDYALCSSGQQSRC